jgi:transcriptional regulator with XRE-family HTH domain
MNFAAQLAEAMGDLTQDELAARSGVSQASISLLLRGKQTPSLPTVDALERALPDLRGIRDRDRDVARAS